ncbi:DUF1028 domain-containing protein [Roseovarius sp. SK2]|uniref:DUF1028 domain-containing protein n=1 Tax=Roseovarius TaxID=74030 RepID=UPI00237AEF82|nr:DUF1028 domain-containing protein [Roseovarius sp. SK2]MDD9725977.1 DUF1028 domain-containing protein [Roseovarius sp. SK2]
MTFSVTGRCERTGQVGVAITTSSIAVGSRCPWVRAGTGAVATQNVTMPSIGNDVLDRIAVGEGAQSALDSIIAEERFPAYRQVAVVDKSGATAVFTGDNTLGTNAVAQGKGVIAAGNLLSDKKLPQVMVDRFEVTGDLPLPARLLGALEAGLHEGGGEEGPVRSACLLVADQTPWPLVDLRVDWSDSCPISELRDLWNAYEPQMADYISRALNPSEAPSYGVPGDL